MSDDRGRGPYAKTSGRRERIVAAAIEIFSETGYWNGSLRDIAARAGISQPGLMHHFPSKNDLLVAVLSERDDSWERAIEGPGATGAAMLWSVLDLAERNARQPQLTGMFAVLAAEATVPSHPAHTYFVERTSRVHASLQSAFEQAAASGDLADGVDPDSATKHLMALMDGLQILWLYNPEVDMVEELRRFFAPLLTEPGTQADRQRLFDVDERSGSM